MRGNLVLLAAIATSGIAAAAVVVTGKAPVVETMSASTSTTIEAQAFERLPTARDPAQLLLLVPGIAGGKPVDQVQIGLGGQSAAGARPTYLQPGWSYKASGSGLQLSGPPVGAGGGIKAAFDLPKAKKPFGYIDLKLYEKKNQLQGGRVPTIELNRPQLVEPARAIKLPPRLSPGDRIEYRPLDPKFTPGGGEWKIGPWKPMWNGSYDRPSYQFELPKDFKLTPGFSLRINYSDPWGETLVDGVASDVRIGPGPTAAADRPFVSGCSPGVLDSDAFCVCGNFPPGSASELLINGASIDQFLVSSSPTILEYSFPPDAPTGVMELGSSSGFDIEDGARGVLIHVGGEIDRNKLKRGEATTLKLWLDGTARAIDLRLWNSTPGIVTLDGGNDQTVRTSGGEPNQVTRTVFAVSPGDFALHYQLTVGACPCAELREDLPPPGTPVAGASILDLLDEAIGGARGRDGQPVADAKETETEPRVEQPELPKREVFAPPGGKAPEELLGAGQVDFATRRAERFSEQAQKRKCRDAATEEQIREMEAEAHALFERILELKPAMNGFKEKIKGQPAASTTFEREQVNRYNQLDLQWQRMMWTIFGLRHLPPCPQGAKP